MSEELSAVGYSIAKNYVSCEVWFFNDETRALVGTVTCHPNKKQSRRQKYEVICEHLQRSNIPTPAYVPTAKEKP